MKLYFVRLSDAETGECFFKVGVTSKSAKERFAFGNTKVLDSNLSLRDKLETVMSGVKYIPDCEYVVEELHSVTYQFEYDARLGEQKLLKALSSLSYRPIKALSGATECFKPLVTKETECSTKVIEIMNSDSLKRNAEAPNELQYKALGLLVKERDPMNKHLAILKQYRLKNDGGNVA